MPTALDRSIHRIAAHCLHKAARASAAHRGACGITGEALKDTLGIDISHSWEQRSLEHCCPFPVVVCARCRADHCCFAMTRRDVYLLLLCACS